MKTVLVIALKSVRFSFKRTLLTLISVTLSFALTAMVCWLCGTLIEDSRGDGDGYSSAIGFTVLVLGIAFVLCFFIVNGIFTITFSGRVKLMGLLTSVGATEAQKYGVLLTETLACTVFCGAAGTAGALALLKTLYEKAYETIINGWVLSGKFFVHVPLVAVGICVTAVSVFAATARPALRLVRISPVEAMKGQEQINVSLQQGFFAGLTEKAFGFYGRLAGSMYDNHKSKYRAISLALSGGTIFYMTCFCLTVYYPLIKNPHTFDYAPTRNITTAFMLLAAVFVAVFLLSSLSSAAINFDRRKSEFAMLKSLGMTTGGLCRLVIIETLYLAFYSALFGLIGSLIGDFGALLIHWNSNSTVRFGFPILVYLTFVAVDVIICVFFSLYNVLRIRRINIIECVKSE